MSTNKLPFGGITITATAIESAAYAAALDCYGVISIAPVPAKNIIDELINKYEEKPGVIATKKSGSWSVTLYITVAYGLKLTEIISGVQAQVKYTLEKIFDIKFKAINVYIVGVNER